jgi:signal transduction histidine kinase
VDTDSGCGILPSGFHDPGRIGGRFLHRAETHQPREKQGFLLSSKKIRSVKPKPVAVILALMVLCSIQVRGQKHVADSLQKIVSANARDTVHITALVYLASEYTRTDMARAKSYLFQAIKLANDLGTTRGISGSYSQLITMNQNMGLKDSANYYFEKLEQLAKAHPNDIGIQSNYYHTGGLYHKNAGNYRLALSFQLKGYEYVEPNSPSAAGMLLNIGNTYYKMGEISSAADYHVRALKMFEEVDNLRGQSFCLQSLGNDFMELKVYGTAEQYYLRSLKLKEELKDLRGVGTAWVGLASVARVQKNYDKALRYYNLALDRARELKISTEEGKVLYEIARIHATRGNMPAAANYLNLSYEKVKTTQDSALLVTVSAELSQLQRTQSNFRLTEKTFHSKLEMAGRAGDRPGLVDGYKDLANLYAENRDFEQAYKFLNQYLQMNDSIRGSEIVGQLKSIEQAYQREKNEKEIALLRKDQELKEATIAKQRSDQYMIAIAFVSVLFISVILFNRYKAINKVQRQVEIEKVRNHIARDLHDDIGSTLSSINLISRLALQDNTDTQKHLVRIAENSSRMMESMSDIVWSINPSHDSFGQVIMKMKEFAGEILEPKNISYTISGEDEVSGIPVDIEKRKNLFLIFKEAINNAAKYSGANHVQVEFKREENEVFFTIKDDGSGFDPTQVKRGNGLKNMEARARSFNGSLSLNRESLGKGTSIAVRFAIT